MQQKNRFITIAALVLALCLVATHASTSTRYRYSGVNNSGDSVKYLCSSEEGWIETGSGGGTCHWDCPSSAIVRATGDDAVGTDYTVSHSCSSGQTRSITASAGTGGADLSISSSCTTEWFE